MSIHEDALAHLFDAFDCVRNDREVTALLGLNYCLTKFIDVEVMFDHTFAAPAAHGIHRLCHYRWCRSSDLFGFLLDRYLITVASADLLSIRITSKAVGCEFADVAEAFVAATYFQKFICNGWGSTGYNVRSPFGNGHMRQLHL